MGSAGAERAAWKGLRVAQPRPAWLCGRPSAPPAGPGSPRPTPGPRPRLTAPAASRGSLHRLSARLPSRGDKRGPVPDSGMDSDCRRRQVPCLDQGGGSEPRQGGVRRLGHPGAMPCLGDLGPGAPSAPWAFEVLEGHKCHPLLSHKRSSRPPSCEADAGLPCCLAGSSLPLCPAVPAPARQCLCILSPGAAAPAG